MKIPILLAMLLSSPAQAADQITVALDWTPNTNHVGLYVAEAKGWFEDAGLDVEILPYSDTSAGILVATGNAAFGIVSSVGFVTQRASGAKIKPVMAVVQHETGQLVFKNERLDIQRPRDLDGKIYAGFGTAWEEALIATIIKSDGGEGTFDMVTLGTSAYEALANGSVDFTLEISTWEGVNSVLLDRPQRAFQYADYGVPDQQTTLLGSSEAWLKSNPDSARLFVQAAQRGYTFAAENPELAAEIFIEATGGMLLNDELVKASMHALVDGAYFVESHEPFGLIDEALVEELGTFLFEAKILKDANGDLLTDKPNFTDWVTNEYLAQ